VPSSVIPYDIGSSADGKPASSSTVMMFVAPRNFTIPQNFTGSVAKADVAATADATFIIKKNGTNVATFTFGAGNSTATFSTQSSVSVNAGDVITVTAPSSQDATLFDVAFSFAGSI
jgi:hypothetical protein